MISDFGENPCEPSLWIYAVEFGGFDQGIGDSRGLAAASAVRRRRRMGQGISERLYPAGGSPERAESLPALGSESRKNKSKHFGGGGKNLRLNVTAKFAELTDGRRAKSSMEIALGAARALKPGMWSGAG